MPSKQKMVKRDIICLVFTQILQSINNGDIKIQPKCIECNITIQYHCTVYARIIFTKCITCTPTGITNTWWISQKTITKSINSNALNTWIPILLYIAMCLRFMWRFSTYCSLLFFLLFLGILLRNGNQLNIT